MGLIADIEMFKRARREEQEIQQTADWNAIGRAMLAVEKMREGGMDENTIRLVEKNLILGPRSQVGQAWRRLTNTSPYESFQVDEAMASGQVQYPKFVGWGHLPMEKLERARAVAEMETLPSKVEETKATSMFEATRAKERTGTLLFGGPKERGALLGTRAPMPAMGEEQLGIEHQRVAIAQQGADRLDKEYKLALSRETRAEDLHDLNKRLIEAQIRHLDALTAQAKAQPDTGNDPNKALDKFNDDVQDALGKEIKIPTKAQKKLGAGAIIPNKDEYVRAVENAFKNRGLDQWYELDFKQIDAGLLDITMWGRKADTVQIIVKPKVQAEGGGGAPPAKSGAESYLQDLGLK